MCGCSVQEGMAVRTVWAPAKHGDFSVRGKGGESFRLLSSSSQFTSSSENINMTLQCGNGQEGWPRLDLLLSYLVRSALLLP